MTQEGEERCCIAREREGGSRNCITHPCSLQPQTDRIKLPKKIEMTMRLRRFILTILQNRDSNCGILGCFSPRKLSNMSNISTDRDLTPSFTNINPERRRIHPKRTDSLRISLCLKSISILSKKAQLFEGYWYHLLDDSRNGFLSISSLAVIHLWGFSMVSYTNCRSIEILMTQVQGAQ